MVNLTEHIDSLTHQQRVLFYASGVFAPGGEFTTEALIAVGGGQRDDLKALTPHLLIDENQRLRHIDKEVYEYALAQLGDDTTELYQKYLDFYRQRSDQWLIKPYDPDLLASEVVQYHHAYDWARQHAHDALLGFVLVGCQHLSHYHQYETVIKIWLDGTLDVVDSHDIKWGQAGPIRALGDACVRVHHLDVGRAFYYHALQRYGEQSLAGQAHTFKGLGDLSVQESNMQAARDYYYKALVLYEVVQFKLGQANVLKQLAPLHVAIKEHDTAHEYYQRAITLYANMNFESEQANSLKELADLYAEQEDYDNAKLYYDSAFDLYGSIDFWVEQADTLLALGNMHIRANMPELAAPCYERALPIYEKTGERRGKANALRALGNLNLMEMDLEKASVYFGQAQELYHQVEAYGEAALMDQLLAHLLVDQGKPREAVEMMVKALSTLDKLNDLLYIHDVQIGLQHIRREIGENFESLWESVSTDVPLPNWLRADTDSSGTKIPLELVNALQSPEALRTALDENSSILLHYLSHLPTEDRAAWLEKAISYYENAEDSAVTHRHNAMLLKEIASLPGRDVSATLHAAIGAFDEALKRQGDADYARTQKQRVALLRDMAGMPGEDRGGLLFQALAGCDAALQKLDADPQEYALMQLTRAHLLRELAGLRGEDRTKWMGEALVAYDEALNLIQDAPLEHATAQTNRASLLQEIASLPGEDQDGRLREALAAGADALVLAAQAETQDYERVTRRMMTNIRQAIVDAHDMTTFIAWYFEIVGVPPPDWLMQ